MTNREKADILRRAAWLVLERGLAKGSFCTTDGCLCLTGAIAYAERLAKIVDEDTPLARRYYERMDLNWWEETHYVAWNDDPDTTAEDVASALLSEAAGLG